MATTLPIPSDDSNQGVQRWSASLATWPWASWLPLLAVTALALGINAWGLSATGYGNTYYAAAARSMAGRWHNFFYGAFDPGGFITVDKPPVFLWVDAMSVRIFGYSGWSLLLPSAVAGAAGVALLWLVVRRYSGVLAATIAALVLALTPIAVAVDRLNLPEPFYILALIGAAACVLRSLEPGSRRWWAWVALAGVLVGVAFNTKMLAAWIPGPALALALVAGAPGSWRTSWRHYLPRLAILGAATLAVSASWLLVVDAIPASDRPYIGGSKDNTVTDLVVGYNGLGRVEGDTNGFGPGCCARPPTTTNQGNLPNGVPGGFDGGQTPPNGNQTAPRGNTPAGNAGIRGAGGIIAGAPDLWRMFDSANGSQIAWFLPFALLGGVVSLWRWRDNNLLRGAVVLWLGWVLLFGGVFSYTQGIYHSYYTAALAPGIGALVGLSVVSLKDLVGRNRTWLAAALAIAAVTVWVQLMLSGRVDNFYEWVPALTVLTVMAGALLLLATVLRHTLPASVGLSVIVAGLLLIPGAWSGYETANASLNTTLPQAGPRQGAAGRSFGSDAFDSGTAALATWLQGQDTDRLKWQLVVSSAQNASTLIADYDLSVLPLGGFSGSDPTITAKQFSQLVADGEVRYVLTGGGGAGGGFTTNRGGAPDGTTQRDGGTLPDGNNTNRDGTQASPSATASSAKGSSAVMSAVQSVCLPVTDQTLPSQYRGQVYDCAGKAEQLAAR